jgi:hypothetical protein
VAAVPDVGRKCMVKLSNLNLVYNREYNANLDPDMAKGFRGISKAS